MKEEITDYISFAKKQGKSDEDINEYLQQKGWQNQDIQQGLCIVKSTEILKKEQPKKLSKIQIFIIASIVLLMIIAFLIAAIFIKLTFDKIAIS